MISAARARWIAQTQITRGISLIIISTFAFALMHTAIRYLSDELHPFQIAFFRNVFGLLFLAPLLWRSGFSELKTSRPGLHLLRGVVNIGAMLLFFYALSITPLATVTALGFLGPIFAAALSVLFLGERFRLRRWAAIAFGFLGMLIILRPGIIALDIGAMMVVASALLWGLAMMIIKVLGRTESSV
ncbi:MAG: DMT family transporter, partial [Pseudomonadota bacterium]